MERLAQDFVVGAQENEIDPPSIGADRDNRLAKGLAGEGQPGLDFGPEPHDIPTQSAGQVDRAVGKPVHFLETDGFAVPKTGHHAAAFGAQIDSKIDTHSQEFDAVKKAINVRRSVGPSARCRRQ